MLDVGCGTAVHLTYLEKHYQPEGLDLDRKILDMAKERLPHIPFHQGNMTDFNLDKPNEEYITAFKRAGLTVRNDPDGIAGRGLYIGIKQGNKI